MMVTTRASVSDRSDLHCPTSGSQRKRRSSRRCFTVVIEAAGVVFFVRVVGVGESVETLDLLANRRLRGGWQWANAFGQDHMATGNIGGENPILSLRFQDSVLGVFLTWNGEPRGSLDELLLEAVEISGHIAELEPVEVGNAVLVRCLETDPNSVLPR